VPKATRWPSGASSGVWQMRFELKLNRLQTYKGALGTPRASAVTTP
jgi:hypothetical protein